MVEYLLGKKVVMGPIPISGSTKCNFVLESEAGTIPISAEIGREAGSRKFFSGDEKIICDRFPSTAQ